MSQPQSLRTTDSPSASHDSSAGEHHEPGGRTERRLAKAERKVALTWAGSEGTDGEGIEAQLGILLDLLMKRKRQSPIEGHATALRLRLLGDLRRALIDSWRSSIDGDERDDGETLELLGSLEALQEELERDWSRRFGLSVAGPRGMDVAAEIAHGLRSSCTSLLFAAEVLREGMYGELNSKQRQHVEILYGGALGLSTGLGDITELSWRTEEVGGSGPEEFSLRDTADWIQHLLLPVAEAKGTEFVLSVDTHPRRCGHARPLRQALLHLALSGLHSAEGGRVSLSIRSGEDQKVCVDVTASGGEPAVEVDEDPFLVLRKVLSGADYSFSTAGLRMHMARELVRRLGDELTCESSAGGCISMSFSLDLPLA